MSDYNSVTAAMNAGTPHELICGTCPWDRLCITPPAMTAADIERMTNEAKVQDQQRQDGADRFPVGTLMTALIFAGKDTAAQLCPVFALKLRSPEGREIADAIRKSMRGE